MIIPRKESWGEIRYDTVLHRFCLVPRKPSNELPFVSNPILLNVDLTFKCNLECMHCVAKDTARYLGGIASSDLVVSDNLIKKINASPFMAIVITGGEPLLYEYQNNLYKLITGIKNKGIIIDTNGTIKPSTKLLRLVKKKNILLRISWDSPNPNEEYMLRKYPTQMYKNPDEYIWAKEKLINFLVHNGISVAIQTVLHGKNYNDNNMLRFPYKMVKMGIREWYIQRFIPSYRLIRDNKYNIDIDLYNDAINKLSGISQRVGIYCFTKKDRRHNSVFILTKKGEIITQSEERPGNKIYLDKIGKIRNYFEYVSSSEHSFRYYNYPPEGK
jgi:MoaA/NifB/PqqE/SkfB family radical SAM enzyme